MYFLFQQSLPLDLNYDPLQYKAKENGARTRRPRLQLQARKSNRKLAVQCILRCEIW